MIRFFLIASFVLLCGFEEINGQTTSLKSPGEFLTYALGSRFTPHHQLVNYFQHVADVSNKVKLVEYGRTYELRPLIAAIITSPQNMARLDEIRQNNLRRTGIVQGDVKHDDIAIVYLSYSIHGNEGAGAESSMAVLYDLAKGGPKIDQWLENTIVIIDPCLNPDGYARFSDWSNMVSNAADDPDPSTREHNEPWPGGRVNHYYFDLNRDWAWQTQKESQQRIAFYMQWMPQVHADLHEMGIESPYYFAPAAQPFHPYVTPWQVSFQTVIGKNHATHFDKEGWRYYTKENYDLFYPSYGDTYPTFSGAVGMTYEQGGSSRGNRSVLLRNGDTLTLADRIAHHRTTSLSTIEISSKHAGELVNEFESYFKNAVADPPGNFNSYIIKKTNPKGRINDLTQLLDKNGIKYGQVKEDGRSAKGFSYINGSNISFPLQKGDLIIPSSQPRAVLLQLLFEPEAILADSITYDITAWSLPMAYGLETYATEEKIDYVPWVPLQRNSIPEDAQPYAYAFEWGSVPSAQLLMSLLSSGITARYAKSEFTVNDIKFLPGTILLMRADNRKLPAFDNLVRAMASGSVIPFTLINTGFVQTGKDLGSEDYPLVRRPQALTIAGDQVSSQSIGQVWYFFEEELHYPVHITLPEDFGDVDLDNYNIVILPEGNYDIDNGMLSKLKSWVRSGGQLIVIGTGIRQLAGKEGFAIKIKSNDEDEKENAGKETIHFPEAYSSIDRKMVSEDISGAVFQTMMDKTDPLSFGLGQSYMTLKTSPTAYGWLPQEGNAIYLNDSPKHYGFAGSKAMEKINKSLVAGLESMGSGRVVYLVDNPLFRSFWNSGKVLFSNALFF